MAKQFMPPLRTISQLILVFAMVFWAAPSIAGLVSGSVTPADVGQITVFDQQDQKVGTVRVAPNGFYQVALPPGVYTVKATKGNQALTARILVRDQPSTQDIVLR